MKNNNNKITAFPTKVSDVYDPNYCEGLRMIDYFASTATENDINAVMSTGMFADEKDIIKARVYCKYVYAEWMMIARVGK